MQVTVVLFQLSDYRNQKRSAKCRLPPAIFSLSGVLVSNPKGLQHFPQIQLHITHTLQPAGSYWDFWRILPITYSQFKLRSVHITVALPSLERNGFFWSCYHNWVVVFVTDCSCSIFYCIYMKLPRCIPCSFLYLVCGTPKEFSNKRNQHTASLTLYLTTSLLQML